MTEQQHMEESNRPDLSLISAHIDSMVQSHRQRYEQVSSLAETVQKVQAFYTELETENARLRREIIIASGNNSVQRQQLDQAAADYDTLSRHHNSEMSRLQEEYTSSIEAIQMHNQTTIEGIRQDALDSIEAIKEEAHAAILAERANTEQARRDHAAVIAENDQLNHGIEALVRAIEQNDRGIEEENKMISLMMDAMSQRIPAAAPQPEEMAPPVPFLRAVPLEDLRGADAAPAQERVA